KVDTISFSVFKLRFRPDIFDAVEPCHFSGRYELGGEAKDVSIKLTYNPLVDIEKCQVGSPGNMEIKVDCGKVELHPLPQGVNDLGDKFFFFKQKTAYEIGLGIPAEPLFRSSIGD